MSGLVCRYNVTTEPRRAPARRRRLQLMLDGPRVYVILRKPTGFFLRLFKRVINQPPKPRKIGLPRIHCQ